MLALCALAIVLSILAAWVLPAKLGLFVGGAGAYDKDAYPLDTSLEAVLPQAAADDAYITASVFAGDQYAVTLQKDGRITLNQFVGQEGLKTSKALSTSCVNFASDSSNYTIPQAIPKMKARRVFVQLGANDVDGSVSVDSFIADYKQFLQSIRSALFFTATSSRWVSRPSRRTAPTLPRPRRSSTSSIRLSPWPAMIWAASI